MAKKITVKEFFLALSIAILGFLLTTKTYLLWLNSLNPLIGFLVYYVQIFAALLILSLLKWITFIQPIKRISQVIGLLLVVFSFAVVTNLTNNYVQEVTMQNTTGASNIFLQSEDGAIYFIFNSVLHFLTPFARIFSFVVFPFLTALLGVYLIETKPKLGAL